MFKALIVADEGGMVVSCCSTVAIADLLRRENAKDGHGDEGWTREMKQGRGWVSKSDCRDQDSKGFGG